MNRPQLKHAANNTLAHRAHTGSSVSVRNWGPVNSWHDTHLAHPVRQCAHNSASSAVRVNRKEGVRQ
ncbi:hypothetical protein C5E45_15090 [Nocardia nova]|uniref:Uncharacterized protein n=1 Tax=Nocardia nova TaxID=37330 RepID=A0A2S6AQ88_9NOCA|nr:hypothetical protein C5E41_17780 [Nocardia nova]PPJ37441.1 hypothetical protein C5E45_15090 [Nocardia nova]